MLQLQGALITQANDDLRVACALVTHAQVSCLSSAAVVSLLSLSTSADFALENILRIRYVYREIQDWLSSRDIQYIAAYAGLYIFARLCNSNNIDDEKEVEREIFAQGVRVVRGTSYFCQEPGWFRLVFTHEIETLRESLDRLDRALKKLKGNHQVT
jgi:aspartate/methionine/tyrosine aminotransferase